jgi:hypothetical protein
LAKVEVVLLVVDLGTVLVQLGGKVNAEVLREIAARNKGGGRA